MFDLTGKNALVTGASGGIGAAIADALIQQGSGVVLSGTSKEKLQTLQEKLSMKYPKAMVSYVACALDDKTKVSSLFSDAETALGAQVDILINNAGITQDGLAMRMGLEQWQKVVDINLTASFMLCQQAIKAMMRRKWGRVINMSSVVGVTGNAGQANYCATKAGLIGMSKALAKEVATRGITVNCIAPGFIQTPMTEQLNEKQQEAINNNIPMQRMGTVTDIAAGCVFLSTHEAQYITGQTLHINGGMAMI